MPEKKEVKAPKQDEWKVNLLVVDEEKPPKKVIVKGEESLDIYAALAKILNMMEILEAGMLS